MKLSDLPSGQLAYIVRLSNDRSFVKKLTAQGVGINQIVKIRTKAPFNGPYYLEAASNHIFIRKSETELIEVQLI